MSAVSRAPGPIRLWPGVAIVAPTIAGDVGVKHGDLHVCHRRRNHNRLSLLQLFLFWLFWHDFRLRHCAGFRLVDALNNRLRIGFFLLAARLRYGDSD
jgi:hypothetical protein